MVFVIYPPFKIRKRKDVGPSTNQFVSSCACSKIYESGIFLTPQKVCSNLKVNGHIWSNNVCTDSLLYNGLTAINITWHICRN